MSLLAPLYFLGALAISLPILFHLIRRQPKGQVEFSSLMFLRQTPPRLTRRSRLDNWPLLLIRGLALLLLATAFARPFVRTVSLSDAGLRGRRLVLVVDTSASMQRSGLWQQALDKASDVLSDLQPADRLAIVTFDNEPRTLLGFEQSKQLTPTQLKSTAESLLRGVGPSWRSTDVGRAISFAGDLAVTFEPEDDTQLGGDAAREVSESIAQPSRPKSSGPAHLILVTDMQAGSQMESLQVYAWPKDLRLDVRKVAPEARTNASPQILAAAVDDPQSQDRVRVRVTNSGDANESRFRIRWSTSAAVNSGSMPSPSSSTSRTSGSNGESASVAAGIELPVQVPPGQSRVVRMPEPNPGVTALVLQGDDHSFDNTRYIVSPQPEPVSLIHVGIETDEDPRQNLYYYLQRVPLDTPQRTVSLRAVKPDELGPLPPPKTAPLVILSRGVSEESSGQLRRYVEAGGRVLAVLAYDEATDATASRALVQSVNAIAGSQLQVSEAEVDDYVMFSGINFRNPLFAPMADPQFNDFTKIRFWSHRTLGGMDEQWTTVSQFDDGEPAIIEMKLGDGELFVMAAGWQPRASQLAMSTKFIPFVFSLFDSNPGQRGSDSVAIGETIPYEPSETATITGPAGTAFAYKSSQDVEQIDQPGIYRFRDGDTERTFAVNVATSESQTEPVDEEELQRFGVVLGKNMTTAQTLESQRQLRDRELESQQKLWQWLVVVVLALLALETILGKIWSRSGSAPEPEVTGV